MTTSDRLIVRSAVTEELDESTRRNIIAVCVAAHAENDFEHLFEYVPSGGLHVVGYVGGALVAHAMVTTRWLQQNADPPMKTAYVDAVATLPSAQGRGHGATVMRRLVERIEDGYEIACLETDQPAFYRRLGWELWLGPLAGRTADGLTMTPDQTGIMVHRLPRTPPLDLGATLSIEASEHRIW